MSDRTAFDEHRLALLGLLHRGESNRLTLADRRKLWLLFGEYSRQPEASHADKTIGLRRRLDLQIGCILDALPLWDGLGYPHEMIAETLRVVRGYMADEVSDEDASGHCADKWLESENFIDDHDTPVSMLGFATTKLLSTAVDDAWVDPDVLNDSKEDRQYDLEDTEVAYDVARIVAGNFRPKTPAELEALRNFWIWYLDVAAAKAWDVGFQADPSFTGGA